MLAETYSYYRYIYFTLVYSLLLCYLLKIILMGDSDVTGFQGYRVSQIRLGPVDSPMMTLLYCMNAITEEHKIKSWYLILDEVTMVHLEGSSYHVFMDIYNYFNFLYFRTDIIFHIINRNIKNPNILQAIV